MYKYGFSAGKEIMLHFRKMRISEEFTYIVHGEAQYQVNF